MTVFRHTKPQVLETPDRPTLLHTWSRHLCSQRASETQKEVCGLIQARSVPYGSTYLWHRAECFDPKAPLEQRWSLISFHSSLWTHRTHAVISVWVWRLKRLPKRLSAIRTDLLFAVQLLNWPAGCRSHGNKSVQRGGRSKRGAPPLTKTQHESCLHSARVQSNAWSFWLSILRVCSNQYSCVKKHENKQNVNM